MTGLYLDPVEDGRPTRSWLLYAGAATMAFVALWEAIEGQYFHALDSVVVAMWMIAADLMRRSAWTRGYWSAARSVERQVAEEYDD